MKTALLCIHNSTPAIKNSILSRLGNFTVDVFEDNVTNDKFEAYYRMTVMKRDLEISRHREFDVCVAMSGTSDIHQHFQITDLPKYNVLYFVAGHAGAGELPADRVGSSRITLSINTDMFYSDSIVFDRANEYKFHRINTSIFREKYDIGNNFYFHLKSLRIDTECINYEDSNLFIRPT